MRRSNFLFIILLFVILVFSFSACNMFNTVSITPPSWIIGSWSDSSDNIEFSFTSNNIIQTASGMTISFKEAFISDPSVFNELISNNTEYKFELTDSGVSIAYRFVKTSPSTLDLYLGGSAIQLLKN